MKKDLEELHKRELVARLGALVDAWNGVDPLGRADDRRLRAVTDVLERRVLLTSEWQLLALTEDCIMEARRKPGATLRTRWLASIHGWLASLRQERLAEDDPADYT